MSGRRVHAGDADLAAGAVRSVTISCDPDRGFPRRAIVLRDRHGVVRAYVNLCMHLPVPLDAGSDDFLADDGVHLICGTHGALYRPEDGLCIEGPCEGESLLRLDVLEEDGQLWVIDS